MSNTIDRLHIIAFDPGESTGWARGFIDDGSLFITANGYDPWKAVLIAYMRAQILGDSTRYGRTVYESWRLAEYAMQALLGSDMQSSQFIGGMKATHWWNQLLGRETVLVTNEPGNKPSIDGWMRAAGREDYLPSSDKEHNRDAIRHICYDAVHRLGVKEEDVYYLEEDE